MSPESRLSPEDLSAVIDAQRRFGGTTAIQPLVGAGDKEGAPEEPGDFATQNGQHPPDHKPRPEPEAPPQTESDQPPAAA